jgi:hypothetical protein
MKRTQLLARDPLLSSQYLLSVRLTSIRVRSVSLLGA